MTTTRTQASQDITHLLHLSKYWGWRVNIFIIDGCDACMKEQTLFEYSEKKGKKIRIAQTH